MNYNELMLKAGSRLNTSLYYYKEDEKIIITDNDIEKIHPFFNAKIVGTVMKGLELEVKQKLTEFPIYFENTVTYYDNSATKTYGPYYLQEAPTYNADAETYSYTLYDSFVKTMVDYKPINIKYPTTVFLFFKQLCLECGLTTNIEELPNGNRVIETDIYNEIGFTYRDVFQDIGQATGTLFGLEDINVVKVSFGKEEVLLTDDELKNQNIEAKGHFGPINSIVLSRSADSDIIYKRDETLSEWNEFKIKDNQLMNDNNRGDYLEELYNALNGIEYDVFDFEITGYGGFIPLQKVRIETGDNVYNSFIFNDEEAYTADYEESIYSELPEETETDYKTSSKDDRGLKQVYIIVDKQNQKIEEVVNTQDEQSKKMAQLEIDNKSITETVESVQQDIKNLEDTYTFSTDLDISNLIIPSNERLPIETGDFFINYYSYFKGKQVTPIVSIPSKIEGLEITSDDSRLKISVSSETPIANLNNEVEINFLYTEDDYVYSAMKKVMITLAPKGVDGKDGQDGKDGEPGIQGPPGENGEQTYFYVKYSKNSTGESMTDIPNEETEYMGVSSTTSSIAPTSPSAYTWSKIKGENGKDGENGQNGTPGKNGEDGRTSYLHIKYSDDGVTFTEADDIYGEGERPSSWRGEYVDFTPEDSIEFSDYEWYKLTESIDDTLNDLQNQINDTSTKSDNNYQDLVNQLGDYAKEESITEIRNQVTQYQTSTESNITVLEERIRDGVKEITTETGYTFGKDGLKISKTGAPTGLTIDESGQEVVDKTGASEQTLQYNGYVDDSIATKTPFLDNYKGQTVNYSKNLIFEQYLASQNFRMEEFQDSEQGICLGFFYTGGGK